MAEIAGGALVALGAAMPLGAAVPNGSMFTAISKVHGDRPRRHDPEPKPWRGDRLEVEDVGEEAEHGVRVAGKDLFTREGLQELGRGRRTREVMSQGLVPPGRLTQGEQRALASFIAGRLPAGQLHDALARAREAALVAAAAREAPAEVALPVAAVPATALRAA